MLACPIEYCRFSVFVVGGCRHHHTRAKTPPRNLANCLSEYGSRLSQPGPLVDAHRPSCRFRRTWSEGAGHPLRDFCLYRIRVCEAVLLVWLGPSLRWSAV